MQRQDCFDTIHALAPSPRIEWRSWAAQGIYLVKRDAAAMVAVLRTWTRRAEGRRALADMDPCLLADVGLTTGQARQEAAKPFWKA